MNPNPKVQPDPKAVALFAQIKAQIVAKCQVMR